MPSDAMLRVSRSSISPFIVAWVLALSICAGLLALTWRITQVHASQVEEHARRDLANLSVLAQEHALRTLRSADQATQLVRALSLRDGSALDLGRWARDGVIDVSVYHQVGVIDAQGIYRFSNLPQTPAVDLSDREHFRVHLGATHQDEVFLSKPVLGRVSKKWTIQLTRRIDVADQFAGVVVVSLDADYFSNFYSLLDLGPHGSVTLIGVDSVVRARYPAGADAVGKSWSAPVIAQQLKADLTEGQFEARSPVDGISRLYHFRRVAGYPLVVVVGYGVDDYRAPMLDTVRMDWLTAAFGCVLALSLAGLFTWHRRREVAHSAQLQASQQRASLALESGGMGVWEWNSNDQRFQCDAHLRALLGLAADDILTRELFVQRMHPGDVPELEHQLSAVLGGRQERLVLEHRLRHPDGHWVWLVARGQVVERDEQGLALRMIGTDTDVTQQRLAQESARVAAVAFKSSAAMVISTADSVILSVNPAFEALSGYTAAECVGRPSNLLKSGRQTEAFYQAMWANLSGPSGHWEGEIWNRRKSGDVFPDWLSITAVRNDDGQVTHYVSVHADITLRKRSEEEVRQLAFYDPLTGLPNRRLLLDRLQQGRALLTRQQQIGAVLYLDLDHFKSLNDTHGHAVGDVLLIQVAQRLLQVVRDGDTVCRQGGDEFVVSLTQLGADLAQALANALMVAKKIHAVLGQPFDLDGLSWQTSASVGVALMCRPDVAIEDVMRQADDAMYLAKKEGRNGVRLADPLN